jgi:serine protease Do
VINFREMKKTFFCIFSLLFFVSAFSQSVTVYSNTGRLFDGVESVKQGYKVSSKKKGFLVAVASGYVSQGENVDNILKEKSGKYTFKLEKLIKPKIQKDSKKFSFIQFISKKVSYTTYNSTYYSGINLKDREYAVGMNNLLEEWGYKVISENDGPFKTKGEVPDFAIAGDIIEYEKNTRGTSSFEIAMLVKWTVFDVYNEKNVLVITTGGYSNSQSKNSEKEDIILAAQDALKGLISNPEFAKIANDVKVDNSKSFEPMKIAGAPIAEFSDYSKMVTSAIKSCVTVKTIGGHGSGFIISEDGYILTNAHVVADAPNKIDVIFDNGFQFQAKVIRTNDMYDVALLKIEGKGFSPLSVDVSNKPAIGSEVITIGTPEDVKLSQTVTKGIISSIREVDNKSLIQTDVSINPGNSGGPLISKTGNVVGIVSAKISGEKIQGLGFAIPINFALEKINVSFEK